MPATKKNNGLYHAFGEWKTIGAWARDSRCHVSKQGLYLRVLTQGLTVEEALKMGTHQVRAKQLTIQGETKTVREWAADPRCTVTVWMIWVRLQKRWPDDLAVLSPLFAPAPPGTLHPVNRRVPSGKKKGRPPILIVAWGEEKTVMDWAKDPRAKVSANSIRYRIHSGCCPEGAISQRTWKGIKASQ
jgi:hypothetical protein